MVHIFSEPFFVRLTFDASTGGFLPTQLSPVLLAGDTNYPLHVNPELLRSKQTFPSSGVTS